jgi:glycosyltransferase involved in cell wall biosynthesis
VVSSAISDALPKGNKLVIHNGYEALDFAGIIHTESPIMRIKYVGQITAGQDVRLFAELLKDFRRDYQLSMIGTQLTEDDEALLYQACGDRLNIRGFVPHDQAIKEMVDSDVLLLIINRLDDNQGILTTKLFEYLASRTPILCFGPEDTAAAAIIKESEAGQNFDYHEIAEAKQWLSELPKGLRTSGKIDHYSVARQADILLDAIEAKIEVDK